MSDLCELCHRDLALPGEDWCSGCVGDVEVELEAWEAERQQKLQEAKDRADRWADFLAQREEE